MAKLSPAVDIAMTFIQERIASGEWKPGDRLPGVRVLCTMAGVSLVTMWKGVDALRTLKVLNVIHGQGIRVATGENEAEATDQFLLTRVSPAVLRNRKWDTLRILIQKDIINMVHLPGAPMPSIKEMANTYGVSFQTLKRALEALVADEVIMPYKRTYRLPLLNARRTGATIVLLSRGEPKGDLKSWTPWSEEFLRFLERECARMQINLDLYIYTIDNDRIIFTKKDGEVIRDLKFGDATMGYLIRSISEDDSYLEILRRLAPLGKPIAISDEGSCLQLPATLGSDPYIRIFTLASAGQVVARHLLDLGHRRIAYISPFHHATWSQNRYQGMVHTFEVSGFKGGVAELTLDEQPYPLGFRKEIRPDTEILTQLLNNHLDHHHSMILKNAVERSSDSIRQIIEDEELRACTEPLFDKALLDKAITAWVPVNDHIALFALQYLKRKGKDKEITIISFDDTFDAYAHEIASYNFNITALAQAMVSWVVNPRRHITAGEKQRVDVNGVVILRKSAKKV